LPNIFANNVRNFGTNIGLNNTWKAAAFNIKLKQFKLLLNADSVTINTKVICTTRPVFQYTVYGQQLDVDLKQEIM
jgi:hypothetical protein